MSPSPLRIKTSLTVRSHTYFAALCNCNFFPCLSLKSTPVNDSLKTFVSSLLIDACCNILSCSACRTHGRSSEHCLVPHHHNICVRGHLHDETAGLPPSLVSFARDTTPHIFHKCLCRTWEGINKCLKILPVWQSAQEAQGRSYTVRSPP